MSFFGLFFIVFVGLSNGKNGLNIIIMGDWGGSDHAPYTTSDELYSASVMNSIAGELNADMVWGLGDNFYDNGVRNEYDPRFNETFESVFIGEHLLDMPFWFIAGNHDHSLTGNVTGEIYYSNHSQRWNYPDKWYSKTWDIPGYNKTIQLLMIDTVLLCGLSYDKEFCIRHGMSDEECILHPKGPANKAEADEQWTWIENTLNQSKANYIIVAGHYPIYSIAEHGPSECLIQYLEPKLIQYNVTAFINGHDHTFESIVNTDVNPVLPYLTIGGTHTCDSSTINKFRVPDRWIRFHGCKDGGFAVMNVKDTMNVTYYFGNESKPVYTTQTFLPRF